MTRVMVVEDEPAAMRALVSAIETRCPGCLVAGTAENGRKALEQIRRDPPDVVITDIRMPIMDGLALAEALKKEFPDIGTILLSGVQEFSYAQKAIRFGVADYLLKPIQMPQLQTLLAELGARRAGRERAGTVRTLERLISGGEPTEGRLPEPLRLTGLQLAVVRENGFVSRYSTGRTMDQERAGKLNEACGEGEWIVQGRDSREWIVVRAAPIPVDRELLALVRVCTDATTAGYATAVVQAAPVPTESVGTAVRALQRELDASIVPGVGAVIRASAGRELVSARDEALLRRLSVWLAQERHDDMKEELVRAFAIREEERATLAAIEQDLRGIVDLCLRHAGASVEQTDEVSQVLDEMLRQAPSCGELMAQLWDILSVLLRRADKAALKADSADFLQGIVRYLDEHMAETVSLTQICQHFAISQTYVSRLFRKHYGSSVIEYLAAMRIERAKRLLRERRGMPLKEIAALVGYADPLYFSRVFKSQVGMPPSDYADSEAVYRER